MPEPSPLPPTAIASVASPPSEGLARIVLAGSPWLGPWYWRRGFRILRPAALTAAALGLAFPHSPAALGLNAYWLALVATAAALAAHAFRRPARWMLGAEVVLALATLNVWSTAVPGSAPRHATAAEGDGLAGVSWHLAFDRLDQAVEKVLPRPPTWEVEAVYLRMDIVTSYAGPAGFMVWINGERLGQLDDRTRDRHIGTAGIPSWGIRVPRRVLAKEPLAQVILRPTGIDPALCIAGHGDARVEPLARSRFFDGQQWRGDRLAGPDTPSRGTYRIYLWAAQGEPPDAGGG